MRRFIRMASAFARNFVVQTIGKTLSVLLGVFTLSLLTHSLGAELFGEYTTATTFLQFFGVIVDFGLSITLVVMIAEPAADEKRIVGNIFSLRLISALICFGAAPLLVLAFPWSSTIKAGVAAGALGYACMAGATMLVGIFQKHANVWRASVGELINRVALFGLAFWFLHLGYGVVAMTWAVTVANILWLIAMIIFARPFVHVFPRFEWSQWLIIMRRSWPMALSIVFNLVYLRGDVLCLALFRSQTEVGWYGAAYRVIDVLTVIPSIFMGLLLPALVADWKSKRQTEFARHLQRGFNAFCLMFLPMVAGAEAVAVPLMRFIAGRGFDASGTILRLLILALPGVFLGALYGYAVIAVNRQRRMIWGYVACAVLCTAGYLLLIPPFGTTGAALVTVFSETFVALVAFIIVRKEERLPLSLGFAARTLIAAIGMYLLLIFLPTMSVLITITIGVLSYALFLFLLGGLHRRTLDELLPTMLAEHGSGD